MGGRDEMRESVLKVGVMSSGVTIQQLRQSWAMLSCIQHQHQGAQVAGVLNVRLLLVEVGVDLQQRGHQGQGEIGVVRTKVFEGHQNRPTVLRIAFQVGLQLLDDIFKSIFGGNSARLQHEVELFSKQRGEIVEGTQDDL